MTDHQKQIKKSIIGKIVDVNGDRFFGITGSAGTGKTLTLYDIARCLSLNRMVLMVHCGMDCRVNELLTGGLPNMKFIPVSCLEKEDIRGYDIIAIDESQRLWNSTLIDFLCRLSPSQRCIFSFDESQILSFSELNSISMKFIGDQCCDNIHRLKDKIRTNRDVALFIDCMLDLRNVRALDESTSFSNVSIIFESDRDSSVKLFEGLCRIGYEGVCYTPSIYNDGLNYQCSGCNAHEVIGMEFDSVVMIMNDYFYYDELGKLKSKEHPNPNYIMTKMLYQGMTRCRKRLALIVTEEQVFDRICRTMIGRDLIMIGKTCTHCSK